MKYFIKITQSILAYYSLMVEWLTIKSACGLLWKIVYLMYKKIYASIVKLCRSILYFWYPITIRKYNNETFKISHKNHIVITAYCNLLSILCVCTKRLPR